MRMPGGDPRRTYEIRCPVHGFIQLNDWEREIIAQPAFQRLRRIRQLAWTDQVFPGAMHTRFEHSLGVMHIASRLYDSVRNRCPAILESELAYTPAGLDRDRALVRLAALLHDVGHGPFSHAAEELMPLRTDGHQRYKHEHYSAAIVRQQLRDVIEDHPLNTSNFGIKAEDVAALLEGSAGAQKSIFWRELIAGQMDADRMDYLLRDSLHAGVQYGRFDLERLIHTLQVAPGREDGALRLGVSVGGIHAAEGLILARYFMFTQVYFHKTRVAFDHHLHHAMGALLPGGHFPPPEGTGLDEYLEWDDWRVLGSLAAGQAGEHGERLARRNHYREVYRTPENPKRRDLENLARVRQRLGGLLAAELPAARSWYKFDAEDIPVVSNAREGTVQPLSNYSTVVAGLAPINQVLLYARPEDADAARQRIAGRPRRSR
jgi:uncharacterized protein